jgi:sulfate permease, SulP family
MSLHAFRPRLIDTLRDYNGGKFVKDIGAGLTVGIVALPLAMAFAIASGLTPQAGLWAAIVGGFLISALGGSNVQIGGPAGAFIVIVYGIVQRYGVDGLLLSTAMAGLLLIAMGLLQWGAIVRYVPVSVVIGFTSGIAVLIALSQLKDALGLSVQKMPAESFAIIQALWQHKSSLNTHALGLTALSLLGLWLWPKIWAPSGAKDSLLLVFKGLPGIGRALSTTARIPGPVVAMVSLTLLAYAWQWPVETIGSKFGGIAQGLPDFVWPELTWRRVKELVAPTLTLAALGAIESLLCARVGDQASKEASSFRQHDPNQELVAQGIANFAMPFVGGMPVTGTIARTVTNARAGACTPVAGMVHAATLLMVVLLAAPLALHIPLAVLAGILLFVAWNMLEWREFARLRHLSNHYRLLMLSTFFLTVVFDLTVALQVGMVLACILFVGRMGSLFTAEPIAGMTGRQSFKLSGSLFFGSVARIDALLQAAQNPNAPAPLHLDLSELIYLDTSGLEALEQVQKALLARGGQLSVAGLQAQPLSLMQRTGFIQHLQLL